MPSNAKNNKSKKVDLGGNEKRTFPDEMKKNEEHLYAVFDNLLEGVQILGHDWRYIYLNASAEVHNRRPSRDLLSNIYVDMWPGIEGTHVFSVIEKCMEERAPAQLENRFVYPDGEVGWFMLSIQPIPEGVLILSYDITQRVLGEKQAMQMKRLYATLSQVNQTIVRVRDTLTLYQTICDVAVQFGEFSLAWIGLLDEDSGEVQPVAANGLDVAQWPFSIVNIHTGALKEGLISRAIRTSKVFTSEDIQTDNRLENLYSQLQEYAYHSSAAVPFSLMGKTIGVLSLVSPEVGLFKSREEIKLLEEMGLDISFALNTMEVEVKRKQAEEELENLARFPGENPNPVMRMSRDSLILYANEASRSLLDEWDCKVGGHAPDFWRRLIADTIDNRASQIVDVQHGEKVFSFSVVPVTEAGYANLYASNITERNQYEKELQTLNAELEERVVMRTEELVRANIELEHANRAKDEFLASMSHELRTPLNSILGLSESLLEQRRGPLNDHQQKSLRTIESSGHHLLELINDILDLSKIEAGKFDYYPQVLDVDALCRSSLAFVKEQALRKSIALTRKKEGSGIRMYADPRRLKQILVNLLTNAVKFTPERGKVTLQVRADPEEDLVQFSVTDNGIGIAPEDLQQLFQPFVQVDSSLNRQFEGTGLGLALVQKLTDLHGGSVQVESEVGVGSRFTIKLPWGRELVAAQETLKAGGELPVPRDAGEVESPLSESGVNGLVLLAEDNVANILTIGEYLESHGFQLVVAHDGLEAIEKAKETNPNVILMDVQMPALDGLEATRRLRKDPRFVITPIIALTALAMSGDRERCLAAGADEHMSKPVSLKRLVKTIENLSRKKK